MFFNILKLKQGLSAAVSRLLHPLIHKIGPQGRFHVEHWRNGLLLSRSAFPNGVTTGGKNYLLGVAFYSTTQILTGSWYIGLIDNASFSALADTTDTMASHSGWIENVGYSNSTRVAWGPGAPSSAAITNGTAAQFNMNATNTIQGIFIVSDSTLSGTSGTLWSTGTFSSSQGVISGDVLKITYSVSC